ncbi:uncharacterized protein EV422DRAFT_498769 [Fimicolochytrium jonesii]|uniref:uncharacterized protein n=1 Tax=Fimicolochytrium jonesii TaxID=1396493 RepID=UPI0022FE7D1B|nr:uncharacterized protein EV422DRAFT_498769 [Fimicolochytrium jonesii]KAI8818533.1 hypothetical protein EV422DRAFT_498769 [Fimicolochytrium jonesii]
MASSDDKEETLFSKRPEWADITPIPQDEGPTPLVPIAYAPDYADAMNCFRAILRSEERSPRVLELTKFLVRQNPAHYTVWKYRLDTVLALSSSIPPELTFIDEMASETPKSYQIWHYRQALISHLNDASAEHAFINEQLAVDSKNYHCWSYRQWAVSRFALWEKELPDVEKLVDEDVRNNSAWNQRYWVMRNRPEGFEEGNLEEEIGYVVGKIRLSPRNESPWAYLRG